MVTIPIIDSLYPPVQACVGDTKKWEPTVTNQFFLRIDCYRELFERGGEYTKIYSGDREFISPLNIESLNLLLKDFKLHRH